MAMKRSEVSIIERQLREENERLKREKKINQNKINELTLFLQRLKSENTNLRTHVVDLNNEKHSMTQRISSLNQRMSSLNETLLKQKEELRLKEAELSKMRKRNNSLQTEDLSQKVHNEEKEKEEEILKQLQSENEEICEQILELVGITPENPTTSDLKSLKAKNLELKRHLDQIKREMAGEKIIFPKKSEKEKEIERLKQSWTNFYDDFNDDHEDKRNVTAFIGALEDGSLDGFEGYLVAYLHGSMVGRYASEAEYDASGDGYDGSTIFTVPGGVKKEYEDTTGYCEPIRYHRRQIPLPPPLAISNEMKEGWGTLRTSAVQIGEKFELIWKSLFTE